MRLSEISRAEELKQQEKERIAKHKAEQARIKEMEPLMVQAASEMDKSQKDEFFDIYFHKDNIPYYYVNKAWDEAHPMTDQELDDYYAGWAKSHSDLAKKTGGWTGD